ncbi:MAG: DUF2845 domain-containing protein [Gammaproteobacteria bacterium]
MPNKQTVPALLLFFIFYAGPAHALRCQGKVVDIGDYKVEVLQKCGEPAWTERRYGTEGSRLHHPGRTLDIDQYEEIVIDEWTYNFGPRRFMRLLMFENGVLKEIIKLDYGY